MDYTYYSKGNHVEEVKAQRRLASRAHVGIVEIGVLFGDTTRIYLEQTVGRDIPVYGIDPLVPDSMNRNLIGDENKIHALQLKYPNFTFIKDYSYNVVGKIQDFDFIFIDGDHSYESVLRDFIDWYPYLQRGGIMAFHDSAMGRGGPGYWPGPSKVARSIISSGLMEYVDTVHSLTIFRK